MLVLPGTTAPAAAQSLRDVGVVDTPIPIQDAAARRRWLTLGDDQVLERDRDAQEWRQRRERGTPLAAGPGEAGIGGLRGGPRTRDIGRLPRVERRSLALDERKVCVQQLHGAGLAGAQQAGHLVGVEARQVTPNRPPQSRAGEDDRHHEVVAGTFRRARQGCLDGQAGRHDVLAQDVLELDGLGGRRDVVRGQPGEHRVLIEDVVELALEPRQLVVGQSEARQMGDVLDVVARQGGHATRIAGRPQGRW